MARGQIPIEHKVLDAAAGALGGRAIRVQHLRRLMVSCEVLPPREEYLARLEAALSRTVQDIPAADQLVIARYIHWHLLPGVRRRLQSGRAEERTCTLARKMLYAPIRLTDHLHALDCSVAALSQPVLDGWLSQHRSDAIPLSVFLRWASRNRLAPVLMRNSPILTHQQPSPSVGGFLHQMQARDRAAIASILVIAHPR